MSIYDDLSEKLERNPRLTKRSTARSDIGLLLFNYRDELRGLWVEADRRLRAGGAEEADDLRDAIEKLRPLFGERSEP